MNSDPSDFALHMALEAFTKTHTPIHSEAIWAFAKILDDEIAAKDETINHLLDEIDDLKSELRCQDDNA